MSFYNGNILLVYCFFDEYEVTFLLLILVWCLLCELLWLAMAVFSRSIFFSFALSFYLSSTLMGIYISARQQENGLYFLIHCSFSVFIGKIGTLIIQNYYWQMCVNSHLLIFELFFFDLFWSTVLVLFIYSLWHPEYVYSSLKAGVFLSHEFF